MRRPVMIAAIASLLFASLGQTAPPPVQAAAFDRFAVAAPPAPRAATPADRAALLEKTVVDPEPGSEKADSQVAAVVASLAAKGPTAAIATARANRLAVKATAVRVVVEASDVSQATSAVTGSGATVEATAGALVQVLATPEELAALLNAPGIAYVRAPMAHAEDSVAVPITGEGVTTTNANGLHLAGYTGTGVKIAVIDMGFDGLAAAQANGDIPFSVTTVDYCDGNFDTYTTHGTAVTEIVSEMAPSADLTLICIGTEVELAQAEAYAKAHSISIINHSIAWFNSSRGDGSGPAGSPDAIAADANANGILWVNAAGNYAGAHWSGIFRPDGRSAHPWNLFSGSDPGNIFYLGGGEGTCVELKWNSWPTTKQDYDLYVFRMSDGAYLASTRRQTGAQTPTEEICFTNDSPWEEEYFVAIQKWSTTASPRLDLFLTYPNLYYPTPAGSVTEPASSPAVLAVGAACWSGYSIEPFSSRGPTISGVIKPDITGPDFVSTYTYGATGGCVTSGGFGGTSASSPHVAGAAALVKQANPSFTVAQLKTYLQTNSLDLGTTGKDNTFGSGLLFLPSAPFPPTGVAGVPYDSATKVSWTAPLSNGGRAITSYTVTSNPDNQTCTAAAPATSCVVRGLTDGDPYTFTVTAANVMGTGVASSASASVTPIAVPDAPVVTATAGVGTAAVSWTAPNDNGSVITGYTLTASDGTSACSVGAAGPLTCSFTGLTNGVWDTFSVVATNGNGPGEPGITKVIPQPVMTRYAGPDNFATAAAVSANTWPSPCHCTAYIAYGYNFPDALAGAAAAGNVHGPILFVATSGPINAATAAELTRLQPDHIVALGGTGVISDAVFAALAAYAPPGQAFRYAGADRYGTAAAVSASTFSPNCGCTVYIAFAMNFPDALAGAAAAGTVTGPVLLVATTGTINAYTKAELLRLKPNHIVVLGGTGVVSAAVYSALAAYAPVGQIARYSGADRYGTAASISSNTFGANCGCVVYVSAGTDFNGALAAAAAAGTIKGPLLLVATTGNLPAATAAELLRLKPLRIIVIGGTSQISASVYSYLSGYAPTS